MESDASNQIFSNALRMEWSKTLHPSSPIILSLSSTHSSQWYAISRFVLFRPGLFSPDKRIQARGWLEKRLPSLENTRLQPPALPLHSPALCERCQGLNTHPATNALTPQSIYACLLCEDRILNVPGIYEVAVIIRHWGRTGCCDYTPWKNGTHAFSSV